MTTRRLFLALSLGAAASACSTSTTLSHRDLSDGVNRTFPGDFDRVNAAVAEALETLPVNILAPFNVRGARVYRFDLPLASTSWGASGRIVVWPSVVNTTQLTVAVQTRDLSQPSALVERDYAEQIFASVQEHLSTNSAPAAGSEG